MYTLSHNIRGWMKNFLEKLKMFQITGGMPEVVRSYIKHKNFNACQMILDDIVTTLTDDFAKYRKRAPVLRLQEVFTSITRILPIEVKAGTRGQMQSLHLFLKERNLGKGFSISHENFAVYDRFQTVPMYATGNLLRSDFEGTGQ